MFAPPPIPVDANGLPVHHGEAMRRACRALADYLNELPDDVVRYCPDDIELGAEHVIATYLVHVRRPQP